MNTNVQQLRVEIRRLQAELADREAALPAHSVKPVMMEELLRLEDERDSLRLQVEQAEDEVQSTESQLQAAKAYAKKLEKQLEGLGQRSSAASESKETAEARRQPE